MTEFSAKQPAITPIGGHDAPISVQGKQIVARDLAIIEGLVGSSQVAAAQQAQQAVKDAAGLVGIANLEPNLGGSFDFSGTQQHHDSNKYALPTTGLPSQRDLTSQDGEGDSPDMTHYQDGAGDNHGAVWVERRTERSSSDGTHTWGSATYRDWSGNFWRSDYQIDHNEDGGTTSKDTVFDGHNEPIKTTVIATAPDGSEKVTTTDHQTGQTTTTQGQVKPENPEPEDPESKKNQGETTGLSNAPFQPKTFTSPNKVNPGPDGGDVQQSLNPILLDPKILVTDPLPDNAGNASHAAAFRSIRHENINNNTIDPPRPQ